MRPVNLIPPDQRRGEAAPARAGAASYIVVAVLFAILFAVTGVVLTGNSVNDKETELASLESKQAETQARADALANFASFQQMKDNRVVTISSLAQSRFDWERVMREVSRVLPDSVWLTNLTGTVSPEVTVQNAASVTLRASVTGPALSIIGCAASQQDVAALIAAIGDIDGVSRVLVEKSEKPGSDTTSSSTQSEVNTNEDCRTRNFIAKFALVAAFDGVVATPAASTGATPTAAPPSTATTASATTTSPESDPATSVPEEAAAQSSADTQIQKGREAAGLVGAGDGG